MKVEVLIHENKTNNLHFNNTYEIESRDEFRVMVYDVEEIKDNIEYELDECCTITLDFDWVEAE